MKRITISMLFIALAIFGKAQTKPSINIIFDGDSQTFDGTYPAKILQLLGLNGFSGVRNTNFAVSGQTTGEMMNDVSSQVVPRYSSSYDQNIVIYYIGYNDSWNGSSVNTGLLRDYLVNYYSRLKSAGFKVIMVNLPDGINRDGVNAINKMYASDNAKISDAFVNCRESGGVFENNANTTYFRDGVHLTSTGYNYLAEHYIYPKLSQLLGSVTPPPPTPQPSSPDLNSGLRNYYKLDETSGDAIDSKSANNGRVSDAVSRGSGKIGGGYSFDANSDYIGLPSAITLKSASYSFWINISKISDDLLILAGDANSSRIFVGINNNLKMETNTNGQEFDFYNGFSTSTWYHIVLTRDNNTVKYYRNGSLMGSATVNGSDALTLSQIGFNGRSFRGTIDEVGIWTRPLSQEEVSLLYNSGSGRSYPFPSQGTVTPGTDASLTNGLSLYYKFDETSGSAKDEAGSNNGTVSAEVKRGASGKINGAYFFDSNNDYVLIPSVLTNKTASYSFWMNISGITDDLLIMANDANNSRIFIGKNNNLKLETNTNDQEFAFYSMFTTGIWYHVALSRTDNTVKLYINGKFVSSITISGSSPLSLSQIGFKGRSFKGTIDELGIWNRALSDADISRLYNNGSGLSYPFPAQSISATSQSLEEDDFNALTKSTETGKTGAGSVNPAPEGFFYPNPAGDNLYFKDVSSTLARVSIFDMNGRMVFTQQIMEHSVDISTLAKGIYLLKLDDNGRTLIHKLMKE